MFTPSRAEARKFFIETWRKYCAQEPLSAMEGLVAETIVDHPEYHRVLESAEEFLDKDFPPEFGDVNPFLHLGMHVAIAEQLSIDQPPGIVAAFEALKMKLASDHEARHKILDCLGEMIWHSQRHGTPPDSASYLACIDKAST
jgi:Domain of unknown function (DUF1841)